jgi:hypothetical protein
MKYESPITCHSKYMANVNIFEKWVKLQGQSHKVKNFCTKRKVLSKKHTYEIPITCHSKDMANVKFFGKVGQTSRSHGQNLWYQ